MGDVGSLALGGAIGTVSDHHPAGIAAIGGIFLETVSVILQVGSYKLRKGKRIFEIARSSSLRVSWSESKIIVRFWIGALVLHCLHSLR